MKIEHPDAIIFINPISRHVEEQGGPYLDWIVLQISISTKAFNGASDWSVMPFEIKKFKDELSFFYESLVNGNPSAGSVCFSGIEPHFSLNLELIDLVGHISVKYCLHDFPVGPKLQGEFEIDQSYLPQMIGDLDDLLDFRGK
ncbi:WapI family immunity protein [Paracidovorax avenae]|uniref:WapI family immunity protein n=1 Tax=Paracidovorax avenae TaxID=80867 RepID=UPI0012603619|nr:hypothetical protein [Paracidovorax avenae]